MVFAVLGILGENERSQFYDNHKIDYSLTVRELFTNVVAHHLKTSKTLDFLCASTPATNSHNLPSWVTTLLSHSFEYCALFSELTFTSHLRR